MAQGKDKEYGSSEIGRAVARHEAMSPQSGSIELHEYTVQQLKTKYKYFYEELI